MTDSNSRPKGPNFVPGVGRLTTDRYDFESHILGTDFRQNATTVDMSPVLTIGGTHPTTVQDAIAALNNIVSPPTIQLATATVPGIVQLSAIGDVQGSALALRVVNIQGIPVASTPPTNGQVLLYNGSAWTPANSPNAFTAFGDLSGSNVNQTVISLSGQSNSVTINCSYLQWSAGQANPTLQQAPLSSGSGVNFLIGAQSGQTAGGTLVLSGGGASTTQGAGGVRLATGDGVPLLSVGNSGNGHVVALADQNYINSTDLPAGTGDMVVYIANAATVQIGKSPNGALLYSSSGQLWIRQTDGTQFQIGS